MLNVLKVWISFSILFCSFDIYASSTVRINNYNPYYSQIGSGFAFLNKNGNTLIVTNYHVCVANYRRVVSANSEPITNIKYIEITYKNKIYKPTKLYISKYSDICFLKLNNFIPALKIAKTSNSLKRTEELKVLASYSEREITTKYIGNDNKIDNWSKFHRNSKVMLGKPIKGDSGSAVINKSNEVVGVFWGTSNIDEESYFIAIDEVRNIIKSNIFIVQELL